MKKQIVLKGVEGFKWASFLGMESLQQMKKTLDCTLQTSLDRGTFMRLADGYCLDWKGAFKVQTFLLETLSSHYWQ